MVKLKRNIVNTCILWFKILKFPLIFLEGFCLINIIILLMPSATIHKGDIFEMLKLMLIFLFASIGIILILVLFEIIINIISYIFEKIKNYIYYISIGDNNNIYLRDVPRGYSPAIVSLLCDKKIESIEIFLRSY